MVKQLELHKHHLQAEALTHSIVMISFYYASYVHVYASVLFTSRTIQAKRTMHEQSFFLICYLQQYTPGNLIKALKINKCCADSKKENK